MGREDFKVGDINGFITIKKPK